MPPTLPRFARIRRRRDFLATAAARRKWATAGMVVQVRRRNPGEADDDLVRIGFTTSRKVGNAVTRNRARRRLRACVDAVFSDIVKPDIVKSGSVKSGLDIVIIGRARTVVRPFDALKDDFLKSLHKLDAVERTTDEARSHAR